MTCKKLTFSFLHITPRKKMSGLSKKERFQILLNETREKILAVPISAEVQSKIKNFQIEHLQNLIFALLVHAIALDASDTGTGKTYAAVALCLQLGLRPLIIGPKSVIPSWYQVCQYFGVEPLGVINYEAIKNGKYYEDLSEFDCEARVDCPYVEITKENARTARGELLYTPTGRIKQTISRIVWKLPPNSILIYDEAHRGKNGTGRASDSTANSKLVISVKEYLNKEQRIYCLLLSATITDKLDNFAVLGYLMDFYKPYTSKAFSRFKFSLSNGNQDQLAAIKKIHRALFPFRGSRMNIKEIKRDTGDTIFKKNDVKAKVYYTTKEIADAIEAQHKEIRKYMDHMRELGLPPGLGYIIRCWQRIETLKVPTVVEIVKKRLAKGKSTAVFINFSATKKLIHQHLVSEQKNAEGVVTGPPVLTDDRIGFIHGEQDNEEREQVKEMFNGDQIYVVICQIKAGGVAISLHKGHRPKTSVVFPTWSAIDLKQALGRIYRADAEHDAKQRVVYCSTKKPEHQNVDTPSIEIEGREELRIEETLCANVNKKLQNIEVLNEGNLHNYEEIIDPATIAGE